MFGDIGKILSKSEKSKGIKVLFVTFVSGILDFVGIAALLPLIISIVNGGGFSNQIFYWCLAVLFIVIVKHLLIRYLTLYKSTFLLDIYKRLSREIFIGFYRKGLLFIKEQGATQLVHRVNYNSYAFSLGVIAPIFAISSDLILLLLISVFIIAYNPLIAAILFICILPIALLYVKVIKGKLHKYGKELEMSQREQSRIVSETYRGFSELEMNGAYPAYEKAFMRGASQVSENRIKVEQFALIPACLTEVAIILALTLLLLFKAEDATVLIGLFSVAALRLLPAVKNLLAQWGKFQNSSFCIPIILEAISSNAIDKDEEGMEATFAEMIQVKGVSYSYPSGERGLVEFNAEIRAGDYVGLRGGSGKGKTTFLNILMRLIDSYGGEILVDGKNLRSFSKKSWHKLIGYVSQDIYLFSGTLAENIALGCDDIDVERVWKIVKMVRLQSLVESRGGNLDFSVAEEGKQLSGGEKQRIGIARALYKGANLLLLDEATSALDSETESGILDTIAELRSADPNLTIISIAHRDSSLNECDKIMTIL